MTNKTSETEIQERQRGDILRVCRTRPYWTDALDPVNSTLYKDYGCPQFFELRRQLPYNRRGTTCRKLRGTAADVSVAIAADWPRLTKRLLEREESLVSIAYSSGDLPLVGHRTCWDNRCATKPCICSWILEAGTSQMLVPVGTKPK